MQLTEEKLHSSIGTCDVQLIWVLRHHSVHSGSIAEKFHIIRSLAVVPSFPPDLTWLDLTSFANSSNAPGFCGAMGSQHNSGDANKFCHVHEMQWEPAIEWTVHPLRCKAWYRYRCEAHYHHSGSLEWAARIISALYSCSEKFQSEAQEGQGDDFEVQNHLFLFVFLLKVFLCSSASCYLVFTVYLLVFLICCFSCHLAI